MASIGEVTKELDGLDEEALRVLAAPNMTPMERRLAMERLLRRYHVLKDYHRALTVYIQRVGWQDGQTAENPEQVIADLLASPEFALLRAVVLATLLAVVYGDGPRAALVPVALLTPVLRPAPAFFL
jgi:hypothetical protein